MFYVSSDDWDEVWQGGWLCWVWGEVLLVGDKVWGCYKDGESFEGRVDDVFVRV